MLPAPPPREREWVSWLWVGLWSAFIFATIPLARAIQRAVQERAGREAFGVAVVVVAVAVAVAVLVRLRRTGIASPVRAAWLFGVAAVFVAYTLSLWEAPEEAMHFVQYGALGALAFRALSHRLRDAGVYGAAALVGALVGISDEILQWLTPDRYWGLRDIWINFFGAALVQVGIAMGLRPGFIGRGLSPRSVRWNARLAIAALAPLAACLLNTPERIGWYAGRFEPLAFLATNESVMFEYGHFHEHPETGRFRSRLTLEELREADATRGPEAGRILDEYSRDRYSEFLSIYTPVTDPFVHEARVHLFRRDRNVYLSNHNPDVGERPRHATIAWRENRILELYFGNTLAHTSQEFEPARRAELEAKLLPDFEYVSPVSRDVITALGEREIVAAVGALLLGLIALDRTWGRER